MLPKTGLSALLQAFTLAPGLYFELQNVDTLQSSWANPSPCSVSHTWLCDPIVWSFCIQKNHHLKSQNHFLFFLFYFGFHHVTKFWQQKPCWLCQKFLHSVNSGHLELGNWLKAGRNWEIIISLPKNNEETVRKWDLLVVCSWRAGRWEVMARFFVPVSEAKGKARR